ncbi:MAG: barstar family protein [Burkholderiales bacterium]
MAKLTQRLTDASRSGVYRAAGVAEIEDAVHATRIDVARIDLTGAADAAALFERIARALAFPDWFGANWDALEDCLCDLSWRPGEGHVLLFTGHENLPLDELGQLYDVLRACASDWARRQRPFFAVFASVARELALPELFRPSAS